MLPTGNDFEEPNEIVIETAEMEELILDLASILPEVIKSPELANVLHSAAQAHFEEDEAYALWSEIAHITTHNGLTIRQSVQETRAQRTLGKTSESYTSIFDSIEELQVYIHAFELWDGESPLPVTFTPLTVDDIDVTELLIFEHTGETYYLEINNEIPDYPIAIVGLCEVLIDDDKTILGRTTTARIEIMDKMYLINDKEPWFKGKAEIYMVSAGTLEDYSKYRAVELVDVNHSGSWYGRDYNLFEWDTTYWGNYVGFGVIERDGSTRDYTISITSENYSAKVSASGNDDFVGRIYSSEYFHPNPHEYEPDDVKFFVKY